MLVENIPSSKKATAKKVQHDFTGVCVFVCTNSLNYKMLCCITLLLLLTPGSLMLTPLKHESIISTHFCGG